MKIHIFHHYADSHKLDYIIKKLKTMGENINELKAAIDSANEKVTKIAADVARLHVLVDGVEVPTTAEWQELKDGLASLNDSLQSVDDATPEDAEPTPEP